MKTNQTLIHFEGLPSDHQQEGFPNFFPVRYWKTAYRHNYCEKWNSYTSVDRVGTWAVPFDIEFDHGLHSVGLMNHFEQSRLIPQAELIVLRGANVEGRIKMKPVRIQSIRTFGSYPKTRMRVSFVFGRFFTLYTPEDDQYAQKKRIARWNFTDNNEQFEEPVEKPTIFEYPEPEKDEKRAESERKPPKKRIVSNPLWSREQLSPNEPVQLSVDTKEAEDSERVGFKIYTEGSDPDRETPIAAWTAE